MNFLGIKHVRFAATENEKAHWIDKLGYFVVLNDEHGLQKFRVYRPVGESDGAALFNRDESESWQNDTTDPREAEIFMEGFFDSFGGGQWDFCERIEWGRREEFIEFAKLLAWLDDHRPGQPRPHVVMTLKL